MQIPEWGEWGSFMRTWERTYQAEGRTGAIARSGGGVGLFEK